MSAPHAATVWAFSSTRATKPRSARDCRTARLASWKPASATEIPSPTEAIHCQARFVLWRGRCDHDTAIVALRSGSCLGEGPSRCQDRDGVLLRLGKLCRPATSDRLDRKTRRSLSIDRQKREVGASLGDQRPRIDQRVTLAEVLVDLSNRLEGRRAVAFEQARRGTKHREIGAHRARNGFTERLGFGDPALRGESILAPNLHVRARRQAPATSRRLPQRFGESDRLLRA